MLVRFTMSAPTRTVVCPGTVAAEDVAVVLCFVNIEEGDDVVLARAAVLGCDDAGLRSAIVNDGTREVLVLVLRDEELREWSVWVADLVGDFAFAECVVATEPALLFSSVPVVEAAVDEGRREVEVVLLWVVDGAGCCCCGDASVR
jgi:hypothetical protein